jgi:hypothetical protein
VYGKHLVIYSEFEGEKENRARLTAINQQTYTLGMTDYRGRWQATYYSGSVTELIKLLIEEFGYVLTQY